jgi:exodeoxyribonuclease VII small subunit
MSNDFSLEDALKELDDIVEKLESGEVSLDEAVNLFEQGQKLVRQCESSLEAKELRIQKIVSGDALEPFEG